MELLLGYVEREWIHTGAFKLDQVQCIADYMYQIFQRRGTTEFAPMMCFTDSLAPHISLGVKGKLADENYPLPVSFIYGSNDWLQMFEGEIADEIMRLNKFHDKEAKTQGLKFSNVHVVPTSDHNMHTDNAVALENTILNDIYNLNLPVKPNKATELYF